MFSLYVGNQIADWCLSRILIKGLGRCKFGKMGRAQCSGALGGADLLLYRIRQTVPSACAEERWSHSGAQPIRKGRESSHTVRIGKGNFYRRTQSHKTGRKGKW